MIFLVEITFHESENARQKEARQRSLAYWKRMTDHGVLLGVGPCRDGSGWLMLCAAADRDALWSILHEDPLIQSRLIERIQVREWSVEVGHGLLTRPPAGGSPTARPNLRSPSPAAHTASSLTLACRPERWNHAPAPKPPNRRHRPETLTPHEERIARMVIDGMTNRKIAERLSVSTRAVELHLTRIYRKLAIRRRAQLATALARRPDAA